MENQYLDSSEASANTTLGLTSFSKDSLYTAAYWARFMGITGYVFTGFIVLAALFMFFGMSTLASMGGRSAGGGMAGLGIMFGGIYLGVAALSYFIAKALYKFGTDTRTALNNNDSDQLEDGFDNLKTYFKINGIILAIAVVIYGAVFLFGIIGMIGMTAFGR